MDEPQKTAIVTDSTACIPDELQEQLHINTVAYYIHRGTEVLRDLVSVQREEFLRWLPTAEKLPQTASPGPGDYLSTYERLVEEGAQEIISIHMTSKGSGAYQAALAAASMLNERLPKLRVEVIDTLNVAFCQGWVAVEAAREAMAGMNLEGVLRKIRAILPKTRLLQTADTLRYLYLGGRIGKAVHLVGSMLSLKPLISMVDGEITALGVARGLNKAYDKMVDIIIKACEPNQKVKVAYLHAGALEQIQLLKSKVEERLECVESLITELSPALMVHTGPGTSGLCFYPLSE